RRWELRRIRGSDGLQKSGSIWRRLRRLPRTGRERETHCQNKCEDEADSGTTAVDCTRTHRTTIGTSVFAAHTKATIHPIMVQPRKKFSSTIAVRSRLLLARAMIEGRK